MGATPLIPQVFVICGVGALAGLGYSWYHKPLALRPADPIAPAPANSNSASPNSQANGNTPAGENPPTSTPTSTTPAPLGLEITLAQGKALFDADTPFLDARLRDEYDQGHIANAFHMTADMLTGGKTPDVLNFLDPSKPVVIYCTGGACDASHNLAAILQQLGFTQCHVLSDGYPAWHDAGYPTSTDNPLGAAPASRTRALWKGSLNG